MDIGTQQWLMIFVAVTSAAVVLQLIVLIVVAVAAKQTGDRVRALAELVETRCLPLVDVAKQTLHSAQQALGSTQTTVAEFKRKIDQTLAAAQQTLTTAQTTVAEFKPKIEQTLAAAQQALTTVQATVTEFKPKVEQTLASAQQTLGSAQAIIAESKPKIESSLTHLFESTAKVKSRVDKIDAEFEPLVERVRIQAVRIDDVVTRAVDRVESVSNLVERGVKGPASRATGLWQGLSAGLSVLLKKSPPNSRNPRPKDEMFI